MYITITYIVLFLHYHHISSLLFLVFCIKVIIVTVLFLAHPNVVLFITHGGLLSMTESIHFGIPIIAIPIFGDQFMNAERAVKKGFAKKVDLNLLMADNLKEAIKDMLRNTM